MLYNIINYYQLIETINENGSIDEVFDDLEKSVQAEQQTFKNVGLYELPSLRP